MDPFNAGGVAGWLSLVTGPYGGAFVLGVLFGALVGILLWNRYVVDPKVEQHERSCTEKIEKLEQDLSIVKAVAEKWNRFMERKAMEALGSTFEI